MVRRHSPPHLHSKFTARSPSYSHLLITLPLPFSHPHLRFTDHYYRSADTMASMTTQYDTYNRSWPDVFVGEYAANGDRKPNLKAGLAEAAFLLGLEHNADKVKASSFAPLLTHVDSAAMQWNYDLILFNATSLFALPSYDVQCMLSNVSHGYTVPLNVTGKGGQVFRAGQTRLFKCSFFSAMDVFLTKK